MSVTERLANTAGRLLLTPATVEAVTPFSGFRAIELGGEKLRDTRYVPGDKLRIAVGGLALRTYTPISWDATAGTTRVLAFLSGTAAPGDAWFESAVPERECLLFGPQRSVRLDRFDAPPLITGDETSFGLLLAWRASRPDLEPVDALFEVTDLAGATSALAAHDATGTLVTRAPEGRHVEELGDRLIDGLRAHPDAPLCLTGSAPTIAALRRRVKAEGLTRTTAVKAYWAPGRKGLD